MSDGLLTPGTPAAIYVWLVPSEHVQEQPGSWRIRKWDTAPFPEANYTLSASSEIAPNNGPAATIEQQAGSVAGGHREAQSNSRAAPSTGDVKAGSIPAGSASSTSHPLVDGDLDTQRAIADRCAPSATNAPPIPETSQEVHDTLIDAERYRWFRNECDWERRIVIAEYAEDGGQLDHHIDKARCGL